MYFCPRCNENHEQTFSLEELSIGYREPALSLYYFNGDLYSPSLYRLSLNDGFFTFKTHKGLCEHKIHYGKIHYSERCHHTDRRIIVELPDYND